MQNLLIFFFIICFSIFVTGQNVNPSYDPELARSLGSDELGMKWYVLVILKTGQTVVEDANHRNQYFSGHMSAISGMAKEGKLIIAGPLGANENQYRGIYILTAGSVEEAQEWLQADPAIKDGVFDVDIIRWYGSAALPEYLKYHEKIIKHAPN
ncbi:MAG TPA: YciI family protein [Saprospiraceae bacterium]|nr:YciI family protein [Saprospiraceae bacterium]